MRFILVAAIAVVTPPSTPAFAQTPAAPAALIGEWRGESTCTNLVLAPACKDETIRYVFSAVRAAPARLHLVADKLVGGKFEPMGEFDVDYSPAARVWRYDFETRQPMKLRWEFKLDGASLSGVIVVRDSGEILRRVSARRAKAGID